MAIAIAIAGLIAVYALMHHGPGGAEAAEGLIVVITMPGFEDDIRSLLCRDDNVYVIAPPGVDPHEYQLRPSDLDLLHKADLVISTGHAPFELQVERMAEEGAIRAIVISVPDAARIIHRNPVTGQVNLHAVIYDPRNLASLLEKVADTVASLRPDCATAYRANLARILGELERLAEEYAGSLNLTGVGEGPGVQYAVEWLGVRLLTLLKPEHGVPVKPSLVAYAERLAEEGRLDLVVVFEGSKSPAAKALRDIAERYRVGVLDVPSPLAPGSMVSKIKTVVERLKALEVEES